MIAIFKEMDADVNLFAIVFGESIFNDAIGIVMYETVLKIGEVEDRSLGAELFFASADFLFIFIGSLIIGAVLALLIAYLLKRQSQLNQEKSKERKESEEMKF